MELRDPRAKAELMTDDAPGGSMQHDGTSETAEGLKGDSTDEAMSLVLNLSK